MKRIQRILDDAFSAANWLVTKPSDGLRKECYIAQNSHRAVFIKFDVPVDELRRLGEMGVSPKVLASGLCDGVSYVVQEYIHGKYPDRAWIARNIPKISATIRIYHQDETLKGLLARRQPFDYASRLKADLCDLRTRIYSRRRRRVKCMRQVFQEFSKEADTLGDVPLVPVHNEPNCKNMLVVHNDLLFIDWDEITLADPIRDLGVFLWWYVPQIQWETLFRCYGQALTEDTKRKIYWFAARASLDVALWHPEGSLQEEEFLTDFLAAHRKQPNGR